MKIARYTDPDFESVVTALENRGESVPPEITDTVREILDDVRRNGDDAVARYTTTFDRLDLGRDGYEIALDRCREALEGLPGPEREVIEEAAAGIRSFHQRQVEESWIYEREDGVRLGQKVTPLERVGLYVPGGTAAYPSSVLMNAIPARVAGVREVVMVVPTPDGRINEAVLAAAAVAGVDRIFRIGGAQAVAALAYGTATVPRVDKIVGPGNIYVAMAKKEVFGLVDIDMVAGPSEILVLADSTGDAELAAADLLSQAEHDALAYPVLVTDDENLLQAVAAQVKEQMASLPRREIAQRSMEDRGHLLLAGNMGQAARISNRIAPEHLELMTRDPDATLEQITHAGAIFLGRHTPEALGDYMAGPNHVLPTGGTARFFSPLGVYDFKKRSSLISYSRRGLEEAGGKTARFARMEGLEAHARAVDLRLRK